MPKRRKIPIVPDYIGMGDTEKLTVQKSTPLQSLAQTDLTLPELKLLDVYLSRIDSHDPEKRTVQIEKGELEHVLGVTRILKDDLDKRLEHLFQVVKIEDDTKRRGFKLVSLFEAADAEPDETGLWTVTLTCTPSAREYIFNIENLGYLRYRLKNIVELKSRYSYILFMYLENNRFRKTWEIKLDDLKELIKCEAETYDKFKYFNDLVLKKCHTELNEKTDCHFEYEPIKRGRAVVAIRFTMNQFVEVVSDDMLVFADTSVEWLNILSEWNLSKKQLDEIATLLAVIPKVDQLAEKHGSEEAKYLYVAQKVAEINRRDSEKPIRSKFAYLKKMLIKDSESFSQDSKTQVESPDTQVFKNFTKRTDNNYMDRILKQYKEM